MIKKVISVKMSGYELTDYGWNQIEDLFSTKTSKYGRARCTPREVVNEQQPFING